MVRLNSPFIQPHAYHPPGGKSASNCSEINQFAGHENINNKEGDTLSGIASKNGHGGTGDWKKIRDVNSRQLNGREDLLYIGENLLIPIDPIGSDIPNNSSESR